MNRSRWVVFAVVGLGIVTAVYLFAYYTPPGQQMLANIRGEPLDASSDVAGNQAGERSFARGDQAAEGTEEGTTVPIQPANTIIGQVSAAGNIELVDRRQIALAVDGVVNEIAGLVGETVAAGDLLVALDTVELERAVKRAELSVEDAGNQLVQLTEDATEAELAVAQAQLAEAEENLADVLAGPSADDLAAAQANAASAWAKHAELLAGPTEAELTQLSADMRKKEVVLAEAQGDFDEIKWRNDAGITPQAAALQEATIDYEAAVAAYEEATAPATESDIQSALSSAKEAQSQLDELRNSPTTAETATAQAELADAQASLAELLEGPSDGDLRETQIALEKALVDLEEAHSNLAQAKVTAPTDGVVLSIDAEVGERLSRGAVVATLADPRLLELTIAVAEIDIPQVETGQEAQVDIDAFPGRVFAGVVESVSPVSDPNSTLVNYAVTVLLADEDLDGVLPGMTAVATILGTHAGAADGWLVPTNALNEEGDDVTVTVVRNGEFSLVPVTPGGSQGEWTVVQSDGLRAGDQVVGSVTSQIGEDEFQFGPGRGGGGGPPRGGNN